MCVEGGRRCKAGEQQGQEWGHHGRAPRGGESSLARHRMALGPWGANLVPKGHRPLCHQRPVPSHPYGDQPNPGRAAFPPRWRPVGLRMHSVHPGLADTVGKLQCVGVPAAAALAQPANLSPNFSPGAARAERGGGGCGWARCWGDGGFTAPRTRWGQRWRVGAGCSAQNAAGNWVPEWGGTGGSWGGSGCHRAQQRSGPHPGVQHRGLVGRSPLAPAPRGAPRPHLPAHGPTTQPRPGGT